MLKTPKPGSARSWLIAIFLILLILGWSLFHFWMP